METIEYQLYKRILRGENEQLDFKHSISDGPKIARTISAFANTKGGSILVGVKDNKKIIGIKSDEDIYYAQKIANDYCYPSVRVNTVLYELEGKEVLEIIVPSLIEEQLTLAPNEHNEFIAYLRFEDTNHPAGAIFERIWAKKHFPGVQRIDLQPLHFEILNFFEQSSHPLSIEDIVQQFTFSRAAIIRALEMLILTEQVSFYLTREGMKYVVSKK